MILCTQYHRPPFPLRHRWRDDLAAIRATGFDAIVLTAPWAWIEPAPDDLDFDDHDELIELAGRAGLQVVVNLWSELQPVWIHREVADAHMVDHMGRPVISSQLAYAQFGLTPGGCTDHPQVRERATRFLTATAERYATADNLLLWDCWNEIRWLSQADGYVCHCEHTVARFRRWLQERHGGLDSLNASWHRRYRSWDDVVPAKLPTRTYTDVMAFQAFLTRRAAADLRWRHDAVRAGDSERPIVAHTAFPSMYCTGEFFEFEPALARGNDWELADQVDGLGSSHFPAWIHTSGVDFANRLEASRSAAGDKLYWISELQGGAAGHGLQAMAPVPGATQARWIWSGIARGAKGVSFWCWRDEVFGRESGGFGIVGEDGHREERLAQLRAVADVLAEHGPLLDAYRPDPAAVGVVLEPSTYHLDWAGSLGAGLSSVESDAFQAGHGVQGYLRAFERLQIPYDVVDPGHALDLSSYTVLVLAWPLVVEPSFARRLLDWVRAGGTLLTEAALDAFDANGLYRCPGERPFAEALGVHAVGRRPLDGRALAFDLGGERGALGTATWVEPLNAEGAEVLAGDDRGATIMRRAVGDGRVIAVGTYAGLAYWHERDADFERFVHTIVAEADGLPGLRCDRDDGELVQWRSGPAGADRLLFVINEDESVEASFALPVGLVAQDATAHDLTSGTPVALEHDGQRIVLRLRLDAGASHVVRIGAPA